MSGIGNYKLTDALPHPESEGGKRGDKNNAVVQTDSEQVREAQENTSAKNAAASARERMVDIGRGNQQAGRQGS